MKICWENIDNLKLNYSGNLIKNNNICYEKDACASCGEPFLAFSKKNKYCSRSCSIKINASGRIFTETHKLKLSKAAKIRFSENKNNPNYKGGVEKRGLPLYETFSKQISFAEDVVFVYKDGLKLLMVRCTYCGNYFVPTIISVRARIAALNKSVFGRTFGESRFYCSKNCRVACPIFRMRKYPKDFKQATSREVLSDLRKMVLFRDEYKCQKCFKGINESELHCHHIDPVINNPIESADLDNCITLCKKCHIEVHKQVGCKYTDLRCGGI